MSATWDKSNIPDLSGKIAIVTGANSGIGLETAACLAEAGAEVIMACRSLDKAETAALSIRSRSPKGPVKVMRLDISDLDSVAEFAAAFKAEYDKLDILCNNAGVMGHSEIQRNKHGFEMQFGTNHLGHFALTAQLFDLLKAAGSARVVQVASAAHKATAGLPLDDLNYETTAYSGFEGYARSKLANMLFAFELDRRAKAAGLDIKALAAHPGYSATNITSGANQNDNWLKNIAVSIGNSLFAMSALGGALPTLYAAVEPSVEGAEYIGPRGLFQFWGAPAPMPCKETARDEGAAKTLWERSEEMTNIPFQVL